MKTAPKADKARQQIRYEGALTRDDAVSYLEAILAGMRHGKFRLESSGDAVSLDVPGWVDVEVRASGKKERQRIRFEITWRAGGPGGLTVATD